MGPRSTAMLCAAWASLPGLLQAAEQTAVRVDVRGGLACPDQQQMARALQRQGFVVRENGPLHLDLQATGSGLRVEATDAGGSSILLRRTINGTDCVALADSVALLLERRVREIRWKPGLPTVKAQPSREAPPQIPKHSLPVDLAAGVHVASGLGSTRPGPTGAVRLWPFPNVTAGLAAGWSRRTDNEGAGSLTLDRIPMNLDVGFGARRSTWRAAALGGLTVELVRTASDDLPCCDGRLLTVLYAGPGLLWRLRASARVFVELQAALGVRLFGETLTLEGHGTVARHARVSGRAGLLVGTSFGGARERTIP